MQAIIAIKPATGSNVRKFPQADPLLAIERLMQQLIDTGRARFATLILTADDGRQTEIELKAPQQ